FFRRAIEGRKKFVCRKGGDRCQLNAPRKVTCQKCRLARCLTVGLQPELVQCKRPTHRDSLASYSPEFKVDVPSTSGEMMPFRGSMDIANDGTIFRPIPTVNPVFSTHSTCSRANLIYRVLQNYRKMYDDRWAMELEVPGGEDAPTYSAAGKVFSLASLTRLSTIMRKQMHYISRFIQETFDDFAAFDTSEQHMILHLFMTCLWELEGSYWTYRNLPAQQIEKMMLTLTTYSDLNNLEYLIMNKDEPQDICQLKQVITSLQMHIRATLLDQMRSIILSEVEFVALLALSLWSQRNLRGHEKAERVASKYRAQIFYDLHEHYRDERKMDNYANRFGDVMCLFVDAQMNATRIGEDIELLKLFNMYNIDTYVYDCLKGNTEGPC
ncbi:zinc finger, C4 type, partial [Ancylostoma caninum]